MTGTQEASLHAVLKAILAELRAIRAALESKS